MSAGYFKLFQGYVTVELTGYSPERFLNLCANRNILIWDLVTIDGGYSFSISVKAVRTIRPLLKKSGTRIKITERHGLPFLTFRYRKRKFFLVGVIAAFILIKVMSSYIWDIEIQGNSFLTDQALTDYFKDQGICWGTPKKDIDCDQIEESLRSDYSDVIWSSARIQGTKLMIDIQESVVQDKKEIPEEEASLVSDMDGVIVSMVTRAGTPQVKAGDQVVKGQLLVSGVVELKNDGGETAGYRYVTADADITISRDIPYSDSFSMSYEKKEYTDKTHRRLQLRVGNHTQSFPSFGENFSLYDVVTEEHQLRIGENFYLPIQLVVTTQREYYTVKMEYTEEEAKVYAEHRLAAYCEKLEKKGIQIQSNSVIVSSDGTSCTADGSISVYQSAGTYVPVDKMPEITEEGQIDDE